MVTLLRAGFLFIAGLLFFGVVGSASAATYYANSATGNDTTGDGSSGNPYRTFHKAYTIAASGDTINLTGTFTWTDTDETGDAGTTGYTLDKAELYLQGQGATTTIIQAATASTTGDRRVFTMASTASTTMRDLTVRHGRLFTGASSSDGAGILNSGTTTLVRVHVRDNYTGFSSSGVGGGINNKGTLTLRESALIRNHALSQGGGLGSSFTGTQASRPTIATIINSTIAFNTQSANVATVGGAGIFAREGTVYLLNSSVVENVHVGSGGNSMGIGFGTGGGTVNAKNSIIANNRVGSVLISQSATSIYDAAGITDSGNNIFGKVSSASGLDTNSWYDITGSGGDGDNIYRKVGSAATTGYLDAAATTTVNHGVVRVSGNGIAVNNGTTTALNSNAVPSIDQTGAARSGLADIGAYEFAEETFVAPSTAATNASIGDIMGTDATISWSNGNGEYRAVFVKEGVSSGEAAPVDNTTYVASSTFGGGTQIGSSGWYTVYRGTGTSVTIAGFDNTKSYRVHVVEFNGVGGEEKHFATAGSGNPANKAAYAGTTVYANYSSGNDSTGDGTSGTPYKTFHKAYTESVDGDTINLAGTFTWTNADETGDASITGYTLDRYNLTIRGAGATTTIVQGDTASTTGNRRVFTMPENASTTIRDLTIRHGRLAASGSTDGGGILNNGTTTIERVQVRENYASFSGSGVGGGINNKGTLVVRDSAVLYNHTSSQGGGIASSFTNTQATRPTFSTIINTTIAFNTQSDTSGTVGGAGIFAREGTMYVLNSTIAENNHTGVGNSNGIGASTGGGTISLKNTIVANNKRQGTYLRTLSATIYDATGVTDSGGNVYGKLANTTSFQNDSWYDIVGSGAGDSVYRTVGAASPTGSLALSATLNTDIGGLVFTDDESIAVNSATTTVLSGNAVPSADQRGTSRAGDPDIGALEFDAGLAVDSTPPSVSLTAPTDGATVSGAAVTLSATASDEIGVVDVKFYINNTLVATDDTSAYSVSWDSTATSSGSKTIVAVARDAAGNYATSSTITVTVNNDSGAPTVALTLPDNGATIYGNAIGMTATASDDTAVAGVSFYVNNVRVGSEDTSSPYSITWNSLSATTSGTKVVFAVARDSSNNYATSSSRTVTLANQPSPTSVAATPSASGATIAWSTPIEGSTKVFFGLTTAVSSSTSEKNTSSRTTSHEVGLAGLPSCAVFKYQTVSKNEAAEAATSSESTFKTSGCTGGATITANSEGAVTVASGGTLAHGNLTLQAPAAFTGSGSTITFQASTLDASTFAASAGAPTGVARAGSVYHLKAFVDEDTTVTSFDEPLDVTLEYEDSDVDGIDPETLTIYRYDDASWNELTNCTIDTGAQTVTCETSNFSDFALFGEESEEDVSPVSTGGSSRGVITPLSRAKTLERLNAAAVVLGAPQTQAPLFTRDLEVGAVGADVADLQRLLNMRGFAVASVGPGSPGQESEYFGNATRLALARYQVANRILPAVGYFGPQTRAAVMRDTPPPILAAPTEAPAGALFDKDLSRGMQGVGVKKLQEFLIARAAGPAATALANAGASGFFGDLTKRSLVEFQAQNGITPASGYFGPKTRSFIGGTNF